MKKQNQPLLLSHTLNRIVLLCVFAFTCFNGYLNAATATRTPPEKMAFQSFLTDNNNKPLGEAAPINKTIKFTIYGSEEGDDSKWSESQVVTVNNGHFSVILGEGTQLSGLSFSEIFSGADASDRFVELTIVGEGGSSDQILLPRMRLLPSPYAFMASNVANLNLSDTDVLNGKLPNGYLKASSVTSVEILDETIKSEDIKNGSITSADILDSTITSSDIKNETISSADIDDETITSADIKNETITSADIDNESITSSDIKNETITSSDIDDGTITSSDIKDGTIKSSDLGANTLYSSNSTKMRIVRGYVAGNGSRIKGQGWTSRRLSEGKYQITFSPKFGSYPIVTATPYEGTGGDDNELNLGVVSDSGIQVWIYDGSPSENADPEDGGFMFIAIGD